MQMVSSFVALGSLVSATNCDKIEIDAQPFSLKVARQAAAFSEFSLTNALATTNGSQNITVTKTAHGLPVGATIGLKGFTTPISSFPCNLPFYQIISVTANTFTASPITPVAVNANATATGLGGTGTLQVYDPLVWVNALIDQPEVTLFNDADIQQINFNATFTTPPTNSPLLYNGQPFYITNSWTYILYGINQRSVAYTNSFSNYSYLILTFPSGYEQTLQAGSFSDIPANSYNGGVQTLGIKVPPQTRIALSYTSASASPSSDTRTEQVSLFIAETGYRQVIEA
jgi:hypothetical protein